MALRLAVKSGLVYGSLYYTRTLGVWGNSTQSDKLYHQLKEQARPYVQTIEKKLPFDVPNLPKSGEIQFLVKYYYNNGIKSTFRFMIMLPCYTGQLVMKTKQFIDKSLESLASKN